MKRIYPVLIIVLTAYTILSSCTKSNDPKDDPDGACGFGYDHYDFQYVMPLAANTLIPFAGPVPAGKVGYYYEDSLVTFTIGKNYNNICSKEHTKIYYYVTFGGSVPHTIPMKVYGDAYYGFASRSTTLFEGMPQAGAIIELIPLEIGLEQQFKDKAADIDFYLNVQFKSLGGFSQDSLYFAQHIVSLKGQGRYSKHDL